MDLNAKQAADALRKMANIKQMLVFPYDTGKIINESADLIESLAAELGQVKQERDGLNIMLTQAQSMLETRTRERDAAVEDLKGICNSCAHMETCTGCWCEDCDEFEGCESPCKNCEVAENWQWRGVKED